MSMPLSEDQITALSAPLNASHVKQRSQSGRTFSYVEAWHCIAEANRIFGFDGWTRETMGLNAVSVDQFPNARTGELQWWVSYIAKVRVTVGSVVREGTGFGSGIDSKPGPAHESAAKEAESDAMKRALMTFGNPFGLALYDKEQKNVVEDDAAAIEAGHAAATRGTLALRQWWGSLSEDQRGRLTQFKDTSLKPVAAKADKLPTLAAG